MFAPAGNVSASNGSTTSLILRTRSSLDQWALDFRVRHLCHAVVLYSFILFDREAMNEYCHKQRRTTLRVGPAPDDAVSLWRSCTQAEERLRMLCYDHFSEGL